MDSAWILNQEEKKYNYFSRGLDTDQNVRGLQLLIHYGVTHGIATVYNDFCIARHTNCGGQKLGGGRGWGWGLEVSAPLAPTVSTSLISLTNTPGVHFCSKTSVRVLNAPHIYRRVSMEESQREDWR